ncbi:MAG: Rieske 2Fe-2S domain-containing protein, partial [Gemmatimonadota bacterium]|nr:Rieske 2Fe-2S domain-containing protein [Gemmatimonadota bacterium]
MSTDQAPPSGPDLTRGVPETDIPDGGMIAGHVDDKAVLVARKGHEIFAIGATCTHYGAPLAEGLIVGDTVRCPWHHACFSLRTGEALRAPALNPVARWGVEQCDGKIRVTRELEAADGATPVPRRAPIPSPPA